MRGGVSGSSGGSAAIGVCYDKGMEKLVPFQADAHGDLALSGSFSYSMGRIHLKYELRDPERVVAGGPVNGSFAAGTFTRAEELWRTTCFEAFFGPPGDPTYWEFNLAPNGRLWNLYRFDSYRKPFPPERSEDFVLDRVSIRDGVVSAVVVARMPVTKLEASLCAVLVTANGPEYYAVSHAGAKADFHLRGSFCLG